MDQNRRPSAFLLERCECLGRVFDYFLAPFRGRYVTLDEILVVFLSQIAFWEWELDNLIYVFTTFDDRATAWEHDNGFGLASALKERGIWVRPGAVKNLKKVRQARAGQRAEVVAPIPELNRVIDRWNELLGLCEERILVPADARAEAVALGAHVLPDLGRFRKTRLADPNSPKT